MTIYLGADHRGFKLKEKIKNWLSEWGYKYQDLGAFELNNLDDYPDFIFLVAEKVSQDPKNNKGIILGASGQGEAIAANKLKGVRAVVYYGGPEKIITLAREHNDSNILSLGASFLSEKTAKKAVKLWLETKFSGHLRHRRRINKIKETENNNSN